MQRREFIKVVGGLSIPLILARDFTMAERGGGYSPGLISLPT